MNYNEMQIPVPSSIDEAKINHPEKIIMMKPKVDQLEIRLETKAIAIPQENGPELEHLKKVSTEKVLG